MKESKIHEDKDDEDILMSPDRHFQFDSPLPKIVIPVNEPPTALKIGLPTSPE